MGTVRIGERSEVASKLEAIRQWSDPRLPAGLLELIARPFSKSASSRDVFLAVLDALEKTAETRHAAAIRTLAMRYPTVMTTRLGDLITTRMNVIADGLGGDSQSLEALRAAVFARPDDDAARHVLADALTEQGDAHGELISLQLARADGTASATQRAREAELLQNPTTLATWAGAIGGFGACTFERGFPSKVTMARRAPKQSLVSPAWSTVRSLEGLMPWSRARVVELLSQPSLAMLEDPGALTVPQLLALLKVAPEWPWKRLWLGVSGNEAPEIPAQALVGLRRLETLVLEPDFPSTLELPPLRGLDLGGRIRRVDHPLVLPASLESLDIYSEHTLPEPLPRLRDLRLTLPEVTDAVAACVAAQPALEALMLDITGFADGWLRTTHFFTACARLRRLTLHTDHGAFDSSGLRGLGALEALRSNLWHPVDTLPTGPLRELECLAPPDLASFTALLEGTSLERLTLNWNSTLAKDALPLEAAVRAIEGSGVTTFSFKLSSGQATLERDAQGKFRRWVHETRWGSSFEPLVAFLR